MGQSQSQKLTDEEKAKQDAENFVNDTRFISWDEKGNLRYGKCVDISLSCLLDNNHSLWEEFKTFCISCFILFCNDR